MNAVTADLLARCRELLEIDSLSPATRASAERTHPHRLREIEHRLARQTAPSAHLTLLAEVHTALLAAGWHEDDLLRRIQTALTPSPVENPNPKN